MGTHGSAIEVFADIVCPFAHVGIHRVLEQRRDRRGPEPQLWIRAWPLEIVNDAPVDPAMLTEEISALRASVAPELFAGFDPATFPSTSLPALAVAAAAYRVATPVGEAVSVELRDRLWERGEDISDPAVLTEVCESYGVEVGEADRASVGSDHDDGVARGVVGSPHFFAGDTGFFCPAFKVSRDDAGFHVVADSAHFTAFIDTVLG